MDGAAARIGPGPMELKTGEAEIVNESPGSVQIGLNAETTVDEGEGKLRWRSMDEELTRQPAKSFGSRISDFFFGLLPIEGQL